MVLPKSMRMGVLPSSATMTLPGLISRCAYGRSSPTLPDSTPPSSAGCWTVSPKSRLCPLFGLGGYDALSSSSSAPFELEMSGASSAAPDAACESEKGLVAVSPPYAVSTLVLLLLRYDVSFLHSANGSDASLSPLCTSPRTIATFRARRTSSLLPHAH